MAAQFVLSRWMSSAIAFCSLSSFLMSSLMRLMLRRNARFTSAPPATMKASATTKATKRVFTV